MRVRPICSLPDCDRPHEARGYCSIHYERLRKTGTTEGRPLTAEGRFWAKVEKTEACWLWTAFVLPDGYGHFRSQAGGLILAHRQVYEWSVGPIPDGLTIDHLCHNEDPTCGGGPTCWHRRCVRPAHLEAVPFNVNVLRGKGPSARCARKTHCLEGHSLTGDNIRSTRSHGRECRECERRRGREKMRRYRAAKRLAKIAG